MDVLNQMMPVLAMLGEVLGVVTDVLVVVAFVLQGWALFTIAKRRGIPLPWLAWIPIGDYWTLGVISDRYQKQVCGKRKYKRIVLPILRILPHILLVAMVIYVFTGLFTGLMVMEPAPEGSPPESEFMLGVRMVVLIGLLLILALMAVASLVQKIVFYMALYDLLRSCEPERSTLYLVLSIVGGLMIPGAYCIFTMLCKNKDLGMPYQLTEFPPDVTEE